MPMDTTRRKLLGTILLGALVGALPLACRDDSGPGEAMEELKDEAEDTKEEIEDEIDDHT
jgi:hypothetical protein